MSQSYLDHAATSPMPAAVRAAYLEALEMVGNPASVHSDGQLAGTHLEDARRRVASAVGAETVEVTFTSGGTESINLALKGTFWAQTNRDAGRRAILLPTTEHHATIDTAEWLEQHCGAELVWLDVNDEGALSPETLTRAIADTGAEKIALISFLAANNEVGTVSDIAELCKIAATHNIPCHVDAVAAFGQIPLRFSDWGASLMSVSAHKIGGPVGVGALVIARSAKIEPLLHGGSQQRGRSGTQNVAGAVAFHAAIDQVGEIVDVAEVLQRKRDRLIDGVTRAVPEAVLRGADPRVAESATRRLPGNAHFTFPGCQGDSLLFVLDTRGVSVSVGSACQAGVQETSHVPLAMGLPEAEAIGSLRMTLSQSTTDEEIDAFLDALPEAYTHASNAGIV